ALEARAEQADEAPIVTLLLVEPLERRQRGLIALADGRESLQVQNGPLGIASEVSGRLGSFFEYVGSRGLGGLLARPVVQGEEGVVLPLGTERELQPVERPASPVKRVNALEQRDRPLRVLRPLLVKIDGPPTHPFGHLRGKRSLEQVAIGFNDRL